MILPFGPVGDRSRTPISVSSRAVPSCSLQRHVVERNGTLCGVQVDWNVKPRSSPLLNHADGTASQRFG